MVGHVFSARRRLLRPPHWCVVIVSLFAAASAAATSISFEESLVTIAAADDRFEFQVELALSPGAASQGADVPGGPRRGPRHAVRLR